jgi:hypothetical protein
MLKRSEMELIGVGRIAVRDLVALGLETNPEHEEMERSTAVIVRGGECVMRTLEAGGRIWNATQVPLVQAGTDRDGPKRAPRLLVA